VFLIQPYKRLGVSGVSLHVENGIKLTAESEWGDGKVLIRLRNKFSPKVEKLRFDFLAVLWRCSVANNFATPKFATAC
jgi:hypothetical protein